ncbi:fibronectin type III domain-containing protein [Chryseobacterium sp. CT-SW4]|uniref:fibronectin type III domain-containing protein n=1 Tax=Chryseobacterium sp. SW-1 TaxID=3157343 RepID=UPI003B01028E
MKKLLLFLLFVFMAKVSGQTCNAVPVPFTESFSSGALPSCWTNQNPTSTSTNANVKWKFGSGVGYGATNNGRPASTYAWVDASSPYDNEHTVELISPQINLTGLTVPYVKFDWFKNHSSSSSTTTLPSNDNNKLIVSVNDGSGWVQIFSDDSNSTQWRTVGVGLPASYVGATIQLKFTVDKDVAGNGYFYDDLLVDEVNVMEAPTCIEPSALSVTNVTTTAATLNWTAPTPAPANGYEYYISTSSTAPTAATAATGTSTGTTATVNLNQSTTYYWWVRSVCSSTDKSTWVGGASFTTATPGLIGSGTGTTSYLPVYSCYGYNYSQQIYTAAEVAGAIGTNTYITSIKFYVSSPASTQANYNQWVVYMGNTTQNNFASTTNWIPLSSLSQVYTGTLPTMTSGQWVEIPLSNPFLWDGTSNIVVAVDENVTGYSCTASWGSYNAGANRGILYYSDGTNPDPASPPTASSRYSDIPRVQLVAVDLQPCTTAAPSNISVNNVTSTTATVSWTPSTGATYVLQYRALPGGTWQQVNITTPLANSYTLTNLTEQTQYEVQIATICGGSQGPFSSSVNFTTPSISYCTAGPTSTTVYEYISNVTVTPTGLSTMVSNSATPPPFYSDYTTDATRLVTLIRNSNNNSISVTKVWPGSTYAAGTRAWIDWNRNGVFEASELILDSSSNTTSVVNNTFSVPATAYTGNLTLRMRVVMEEGGTPDACGTFTWGEVEDYAVRLIDLQPCTTAPPTNVTVSNLTASTAYVSWLPTAGATYIIRWREGSTGAWLPSAAGQTLPAGQSYYTIPGLNEQTNYEVQIATICNGTTGSFGTSVPFTTPPISYCNMTGTGTNDHISNVSVTPSNQGLAPISNTSVQTNYISYTTPVVNLEIGSSGNILSVSKGWTGSTYSDAVAAWIDFNRDGVFDTSEQIMDSSSSTTTPVTSTFSVPANAYSGALTTTMRVVLRRSSDPVMCQSPTNGEVEDYAVKLRPCSSATPGLPTFSNITHNAADIAWTGATNNLTYLVQYRELGTPTWTDVYVTSSPYQVTNLTPATTYEVQISAVCGATPGTPTAIQTFTTRCDPTPPNVTVSNITTTTALVTWAPLAASSTYVLRYREVGTTTWTEVNNLPAPPANSYTIQGLDPYTTYEVQVANKCINETTINPYSNVKVFTTERTCELPPPGLTITNITPTTAVVEWDPFPGATYILRYRKVGIPSWTNIAVSTNTHTLIGLTELTKYEMQVVNVCNGTPGTYTEPYYFTTPTVIYCQMSSTNSASEYISNVTVKPNGKPEMSNDSGANNYSDFTNDPAAFIELVQGSTNNEISITKSWVGNNENEGVAVWIDFDRNGYFDIDERILVSSPNTTTPVTGTFSVPADAFISMTDYKYVVMRVAMQRDGIPVNCTSFDNGEVEDYTVRISKQIIPNPTNQTDILVYPNPVRSVLNVKNISARANYKLYNVTGQIISTGIILNNKIDVSQLSQGVYVIDIEDGQVTAQKKFIKE